VLILAYLASVCDVSLAVDPPQGSFHHGAVRLLRKTIDIAGFKRMKSINDFALQ
jgi:hypothetical protein